MREELCGKSVACFAIAQAVLLQKEPKARTLVVLVNHNAYFDLTLLISTCQSTPDSIWCLAAKSPWLMATATSSRLFR